MFIGRVSISMCSNLCSIFDLYIKWLSLPQVFPTIFKMKIGICSNRISFRKRTAEQECNSLPFFHSSAVIWIKKFMWTSTYNFLTTFLRFLILNIGIKSENVVVDKCTNCSKNCLLFGFTFFRKSEKILLCYQTEFSMWRSLLTYFPRAAFHFMPQIYYLEYNVQYTFSIAWAPVVGKWNVKNFYYFPILITTYNFNVNHSLMTEFHMQLWNAWHARNVRWVSRYDFL